MPPLIGDGLPPVTGAGMRHRPLREVVCQVCDWTGLARLYARDRDVHRVTYVCEGCER